MFTGEKFALTIRRYGFILAWFTAVSGSQVAIAADNPFAGGWVLDTESSSLTFQTIKNGSKLETSSFASYQGAIDESGSTEIRIQLDSVDTKVDLRNVRMRFLFFETFKFKEAVVSARIDPATIQDLQAKNRLSVPLEFELDLHGIKKTLQIETTVTSLAGGQVSVASAAPLSIATSMFGLDEGVKKLEEAAEVEIVPMGSVSFNLIFNAFGDGASQAAAGTSVAAPEPAAAPAPVSAALETAGNFSAEECIGRFEILSRTGAIYFRTGSARLDPDSKLVLATVIDIIDRCPQLKIVIEGHTDSDGGEIANLRLSESRAESVMGYLVDNANVKGRIRSVGYGESNPVASNDTARDRSRNRRIEFVVDQ